MKKRKLIFSIGLLVFFTHLSSAQNNKPVRKSNRPPKTIDSSAVKVYLEYTCSVDKEGTVRNQKGEIIGKMAKDGVIRDLEGNIIGRREKTRLEASREAIMDTY